MYFRIFLSRQYLLSRALQQIEEIILFDNYVNYLFLNFT